MNASMVTPTKATVKNSRFVPAAPPDQDAELERQMGRNLYRRGRGLDACVTDEMTRGWLAAEAAGADAYYAAMQRQASEFRCVNWNSVEVW